MLAFLDTLAQEERIYFVGYDIWAGNKNNVSVDSKGYTNMVTANLADAVVCSFDCLWVSKMILEKQINTLTRDKRSIETVPTCKCPVSIPPGNCEREGWYLLGNVTEFTETGSFPCTSLWREIGSVV